MSVDIEQAMRDGYVITYNHPATYLTDEANEEQQWSVTRSIAPYGSDVRHWSGHTIQEALDKAKLSLQPYFEAQRIEAGKPRVY
jgi:hypothetical protein